MVGMALVMMPVMTNGLNQLPAKSNPHGVAINSTLQQVAGAIGSALLLTIMTTRMGSVGVSLMVDATDAGDMPTTAEGLGALQQEIEKQAMLEGISYAFFIATLIAFVGLVLAFFIKRVEPPVSEFIESNPQEEKE